MPIRKCLVTSINSYSYQDHLYYLLIEKDHFATVDYISVE